MRKVLPRLSEIYDRLSEGRSYSHGFKRYLEKRKWTLPPDEYVGHLNYLKRMQPIYKKLEALQRGRVFEEPRFTKEEQEALRGALDILKASLIPRALIKKGEDDDFILL